MQTKLFEIRDRRTFIPVIATRMFSQGNESELYLLRRGGFSNEHPLIMVTKVEGDACNYDCYSWDNRTMRAAHKFIEENFPALVSGDVIDVEFILGETNISKISERFQ